MEPRFGHNFSKVRVHADERSAQSARSVNALAYTVGRDVVFGRGQYAPSTQAGKALLAHELSHVVQQGFRDARNDQSLPIGNPRDRYEEAADQVVASLNDARPANSRSLSRGRVTRFPAMTKSAVQRQECAIQPVKDECSGAGAKCLTVAETCKKKFPNPGDLDSYITLIKDNFQTSDFGPNAKRNFAHWLDGSGTELAMPSALFAAHDGTKDALLTHKKKFVDGAQKRLKDGSLKPDDVSDVLKYTGHADSYGLFPPAHSDDLAYAVGGFQLCSNVRLVATKLDAKTYGITFREWKCQAHDCYNWDPGKGIGNDQIDDTKLCCIENVGKAKHFLDHSDVWDNKDPDSMRDAQISVAVAPPPAATGSGTTPAPPAATPPPTKQEGSR